MASATAGPDFTLRGKSSPHQPYSLTAWKRNLGNEASRYSLEKFQSKHYKQFWHWDSQWQ